MLEINDRSAVIKSTHLPSSARLMLYEYFTTIPQQYGGDISEPTSHKTFIFLDSSIHDLTLIYTWISQTFHSIPFKAFDLEKKSTVEPQLSGPRFEGEPRITGQEPADQAFHYICLLQKPRFT